MYKVFVNDRPIILTCFQKNNNNFPVYRFHNVVVAELVHKLKHNKLAGVNLYTTNLEADWQLFLTHFKKVSAAGGLVLNASNHVLFIYRNNTWDLPKGHIEKGESVTYAAVREVEEECGIDGLTIVKPLITTYHVYFEKTIKLKETFWFLMTTNTTKIPTPQLEEGITKACFRTDKAIVETLSTTYENIKLVYNTFKEL